MTMTRKNAAFSACWRGRFREIEKIVQNCDMCTKFQTQKIDPVRGTPFPNKPWGKVAADFFVHKGHSFLFVVDYYLRDGEICLVSTSVKTAENIDSANEESVVFCGHGVCDSLMTALNLHPNNLRRNPLGICVILISVDKNLVPE